MTKVEWRLFLNFLKTIVPDIHFVWHFFVFKKRKYNSKIYAFIINILQDEEKVITFAREYLRNKMYVLIFFLLR